MNSVYIENLSEEQLDIRLLLTLIEVNCNVHETLALTMDQDTTCKPFSTFKENICSLKSITKINYYINFNYIFDS